ncbi:MAG: hypothetical protein II222_03795 [Paraprevotella sp.]|nr:hypothetical protein [Paraprevotella sp.]
MSKTFMSERFSLDVAYNNGLMIWDSNLEANSMIRGLLFWGCNYSTAPLSS